MLSSRLVQAGDGQDAEGTQSRRDRASVTSERSWSLGQKEMG